MNKSKIEWCDYTWNPVTGCVNDCPYCYARKIAERFAGCDFNDSDKTEGVYSRGDFAPKFRYARHVLKRPLLKKDGTVAPYPYGFDPTFHQSRLDELQRIKKPSSIFVCSMADLFVEPYRVYWRVMLPVN
jgi:protein gp37